MLELKKEAINDVGSPVIRCPDGELRSYAEYEDDIKPFWKEIMRKTDKIRCR